MWRRVFPDLAGVLAERDIEHPVKPILNAPMRPRAQRQVFGSHLARTDGVTPLSVGHLVADCALRHDAGNGLAGRPLVERSVNICT